jgi:alkylhydroperoxidase family enzyme
MTRVPYVKKSDLELSVQCLLDSHNNIQQSLANGPIAFERFEGVGRWILYTCPIEARKRELMIITTAYLANAVYPFCHHIWLGTERADLTAEEINEIPKILAGRESDLELIEVLLVKAAAELTSRGDLSDEIWSRLRGRYGDRGALLIVYVIGFYNLVSRVANGLKVDLEPRFQDTRRIYWDAWRAAECADKA